MGKKRKFSRFIRWMKSELPEDNKSVLLLAVTKIPSPKLGAQRARPQTIHLDHHLAAKSQTIGTAYRPSRPPRLFRSHSKDSLNELLAYSNQHAETGQPHAAKFELALGARNGHTSAICKRTEEPGKFLKRVSFDVKNLKCTEGAAAVESDLDKKVGFCTELPFEVYHPDASADDRGAKVDEKVVDVMDKSVDSIGSCSLDVDASSTDFSDTSFGSSDCTLRSVGLPTPTTQPTTAVPTLRIESSPTDVELKKPSYLNLACTVNGYSNITNYDSKHRENFRISKSREVSPIRPQEYHASGAPPQRFLTPEYTKPQPKMSESKTQIFQSTQYSYTTSARTIRNYSGILGNDSVDACYNRSPKLNGAHYTSKTKTNGETNSKSFIQQRIERLYGPGALAQGFFISKRSKSRLSESESDAPNNNNEPKIHNIAIEIEGDEKPDAALPVLRHLRPEFRAQLPILSPKRSTDNILQKSNTVPSALTNGLALNGSKSNDLIGENKENVEEIIAEPEKLPAAPQVILPISKDVSLNGTETKAENGVSEIRDGHYFLKILKSETTRLLAMAERVEAELQEKLNELTEDQLGYLRSASGKARLLVTQKMQQFEGLCHKNINQISGEPFPTTAEDLQGFWDMVLLQVTQVDRLYAELDVLRNNNWEEVKPQIDSVDSSTKPKKVLVKKPISAKAEAERKQREAARKKMIEEKRRAMRNKQQQDIQMFVPEAS